MERLAASWLFVPAIRWAFAIRPEWGSNNLAQGRAQRRPGYGVRQREIALKGQNSLGSVVCIGRSVRPLRGNGRCERFRTQGGASLCPGLLCLSPLG